MIPVRGIRMVALGALLSLGSGCYTYQVVQQPRSGAEVRAVLTVEGAVRQSERLGQPIRSLSGRFVAGDDARLHLDVITGQSRGTFNDIVLRDTLAVPRDQIVALEEREVSWIRTALVGVAAAAVAVVAIGSVTSGGGDIEGGSGPGTQFEPVGIPFFRIGR